DVYKRQEEYHDRVPAKTIASLFVVTLRGLRKEGIDPEEIPDSYLEEIVDMIANGVIAKEAAEEILAYSGKNNVRPREAAGKLGLTSVSPEEAERIIEEIINSNIDVVKAKGMRAMSMIMGKAMARLRGRIDGKIVADIVRRKIQEVGR
ncbi:MAG: GatB/YqeY domain-containing protein, partial [Desulfurococcales archaeon]|nr:GatB/YqeY domain-containing protein [Desulfurococcales archaeon]